MHLNIKGLLEVLLHDRQHVFPELAELGIAGHVEIEEAIVLADAEESLVLRFIVCSEKVELDGWERLRDEDGLGDGHVELLRGKERLKKVSPVRER